jgi:hypothetical protein
LLPVIFTREIEGQEISISIHVDVGEYRKWLCTAKLQKKQKILYQNTKWKSMEWSLKWKIQIIFYANKRFVFWSDGLRGEE